MVDTASIKPQAIVTLKKIKPQPGNGGPQVPARSSAQVRPRRLQRLYDNHWMIIGSSLILIGLGLALMIYFLRWLPPIPAICIGGIAVLFFTAVGFNVLSSEEDMTTGEVQKAITFAVLYVFFGLMAFGDGVAGQDTILSAALENFWIIVVTVIGFYFGSRIIDQFRAPLRGPVDALIGDKVWELRKRIRQGEPLEKLSGEIGQVQGQLQPLVELQALAVKKK